MNDTPAPSHSALLELKKATIAYNGHEVVRNLSFSLKQDDIGCLLGPSGCGKTTALPAIAGFEPVGGGAIMLSGKNVAGPGFGLPDTGRKYPHELSGGQQQRVALAPRPALLLLDEPFSSLDVELRERLGQEVRDILKAQNTTALLVTHDQYEAFAIADEIGVMRQGELQQWDSAYNLYHRPSRRFVADFIGEGVFLPGQVKRESGVEMELGTLGCDSPDTCSIDCAVDVLLRPDDIIHDDASPLQAEVRHNAFRGAEILYTLRLSSGQSILSLVPSHHNHALGEKIGIRLAVDHVVVFLR